MKTRSGVIYSTDSSKCVLDLYMPETVQKPPVYIFFHGGGLEAGDRALPEKVPAFFTAHGIAMVSADYRLYPEAKFPDYIVDAANAVRWVLEESGEAFSSIIVGGASAGAYLSMLLYFDPTYLQNAGVDPKQICGYLFNAGQPTTHYNYLHYEKKLDPRSVVIDETAAIYYVKTPYEDPDAEPMLFFACSDHDMTNRLNQTNVLVTAMLSFGFPKEKCLFRVYENETHCSYCEKDFFLEDSLAFIKRAAGVKG